MTRTVKAIRAELRAVRSEMRALGIKRMSCFNGGLDRNTYQYNTRCFALITELETAQSKAKCLEESK